MQTFNKTLLFIIGYFIYSIASAQDKLQVLIVGSSHYNEDTAVYYREVLDKLKHFQPDMLFGEYLAPEDLISLEEDNFGKTAFQKQYTYIDRLNPIFSKSSQKAIARTYRSLSKFRYLHKARMNLVIDLVKNYDRGNADYQVFILETYMKPHFGKEELAYYETHLGTLDSLKKAGLFKETSEYHRIFFPLAYELNLDKIYPMDCQKYDLPWTEAWQHTINLNKAMRKQAGEKPEGAVARTVKLIDEYSSYTKEEEELFNSKPYEFMNSDRYKSQDAALNFYGGEAFYGFAGFPTKAVKQMKYYWKLRNKAMCENIVKQARVQKAKKIVVAVGASHLKMMEEILSEYPEVELIGYNEL